MKKIIFLSVLVLVATIIFGPKYQQKQLEQLEQTYAKTYGSQVEQLGDTSKDETSETTKHSPFEGVESITVLGDSISYGEPETSAGKGTKKIFSTKDVTYFESTNTQSWVTHLQQSATNLPIHNYSFEKKTSIWMNQNINSILSEPQDVVMVMVGIHDREFLTLDEYKKSMTTLLASVKEKSKRMIVLSLPPAPTNDVYFYFSPEELNKTLQQISNDNGYEFIDIYSEMKALNNNNLMKSDTFYPTEEGSNTIWSIIEKNM